MTFDNNTHGAFIQFKLGDDVVRAFVDGIPDECDHDDEGEVLEFNDAGEYFKVADMPDHNTDPEGWLKFHDDHKITGGCVLCSKCGKPFTPPMF